MDVSDSRDVSWIHYLDTDIYRGDSEISLAVASPAPSLLFPRKTRGIFLPERVMKSATGPEFAYLGSSSPSSCKKAQQNQYGFSVVRR
jgi:hypothetical protein